MDNLIRTSVVPPGAPTSGHSLICSETGHTAIDSAIRAQSAVNEETIFIPQEARGTSLAAFPLSVRLRHIFEQKNISLVGDLHGLAFSKCSKWRNCGGKTVSEIRALVREIQHAKEITAVGRQYDGVEEDASPCIVAGAFFIPANSRTLSFADLPLSPRLEHVLQREGMRRLADVHGVPINGLRALRDFGSKTLAELVRLIERVAAGEFGAATEVGWNPVGLVASLDALIMGLPDRDQDILLLRLGGKSDEVSTLEEIGRKFSLTRERVRQIVNRCVERLRRRGGLRLKNHLKRIEGFCCHRVCPLTPALLKQWLENSPALGRFSVTFYVRLLIALQPTIPAWPVGQDAAATQRRRCEEIEVALDEVLRGTIQSVSLAEALARLRSKKRLRRLTATAFLATLQHSRRFIVELFPPDAPVVRLAKRAACEAAQAVLQASDAPLTPEQILDRARSAFGQNGARWNPRTLENALVEEKGFYLLGPRAYGLRQHFSIPREMCRQACTDFVALLKQENRPISTAEVVNMRRFEWAGRTNTHELACILREDHRLIDLGKFLFALAEWGIEEREYIKDLIPRVLEKSERPLTGAEVFAQLQQLRSVSPTCISSALRNNPLVREYGFGHYGLKSWGESVKHRIVTDANLVERVIYRATPPLTFARLVEILDVLATGQLADNLWQTCAALPVVLRIPEDRSPDTRLIHRSCSLERALVATAREVNRPLPLYEFQWELNERFGSLFASKSLDELRRCLEQSQMFLRNATDEFILDIHLDQLGLNANAIRHACAEMLFAYSGDFEQSFHAITSSRSGRFRARSPEHFGRGVGA